MATSELAAPEGRGYDVGSVVGNDVVPCEVDDDEISVAPPDPDPADRAAPPVAVPAPATALARAFAALQGLIERVPAAPSGPRPPLSGSSFRTTDNLGRSADALDVTANPVERAPSYLGVYHVNVGRGRSRHYRDPVALLSAAATAERTLPRRLSTTNEGTPSFRSVTWRGSLAASQIKLAFHYLDHGPRRLAVDREARGTLEEGRWSVVAEAGIDRSLSRMGFHGNHGARRQFRFRGRTWRIYEAQKLVNVTGSWRVVLCDAGARTAKILRISTPGRSRSFANPIVNVLPSPHPSGGDALVVSMFVNGAGAGPGEPGELVYYRDLP